MEEWRKATKIFLHAVASYYEIIKGEVNVFIYRVWRWTIGSYCTTVDVVISCNAIAIGFPYIRKKDEPLCVLFLNSLNVYFG